MLGTLLKVVVMVVYDTITGKLEEEYPGILCTIISNF